MSKLDIKVFPKQKQALDYLWDDKTRYIVYGGGAGGGKSCLGCLWLIMNCYKYPGTKWFIGRQELSRLMKSTYVTFQKVFVDYDIPQNWRLDGKYNFIEFENGSRIDLIDMVFQPRDPEFNRFGSLEYTGGWIEEAGEVDERAFQIISTRLGRHMNDKYELYPPKILITCNPSKNWLYQKVYKPWKEKRLDMDWVFIKSLYNENPHTAEEYGKTLSKMTNPALKEKLMMGVWEYADDANALVSFDAISDLFTNEVEKGSKYLTADIARYGSDKIVVMCWEGLEVYKIITDSHKGTDQTANMIRNLLSRERIPYSHAIIDEDGVGGGVLDLLRGCKGFKANSAPFRVIKKEQINYRNLKAQCGYTLAEYINEHKIAVKTDDDEIRKLLTEDLEQLKSKDIMTEGKLQLKPKDEIKQTLGRSPDYSDNLLMRMYFEVCNFNPAPPPPPKRIHGIGGTRFADKKPINTIVGRC